MKELSPWRSGEKWVYTRLHGSVTVPCSVLSIKVKHNILDDLVEVYIPKRISMSLGWKTAPKKVLKLSDLITVCWASCLLWCLYCFVIAHVDMDMTQCTTHIIFNSGNINGEAIRCRAELAACPWAEEWLRMICRGPFKGMEWFSGPGCELHSPGDPTLFTGFSWECSPGGVGVLSLTVNAFFPGILSQATLIIIKKNVTCRLETCKTRHWRALPGVNVFQEFQVLLWMWASGCFPASHVQSGQWIFFFKMCFWSCLIYKCWMREGEKWRFRCPAVWPKTWSVPPWHQHPPCILFVSNHSEITLRFLCEEWQVYLQWAECSQELPLPDVTVFRSHSDAPCLS